MLTCAVVIGSAQLNGTIYSNTIQCCSLFVAPAFAMTHARGKKLQASEAASKQGNGRQAYDGHSGKKASRATDRRQPRAALPAGRIRVAPAHPRRPLVGRGEDRHARGAGARVRRRPRHGPAGHRSAAGRRPGEILPGPRHLRHRHGRQRPLDPARDRLGQPDRADPRQRSASAAVGHPAGAAHRGRRRHARAGLRVHPQHPEARQQAVCLRPRARRQAHLPARSASSSPRARRWPSSPR